MRQGVATAVMLSLVCAVTAANAAIVPIFVANHSFESPIVTPPPDFIVGSITGWTLSSPADQGVFNPVTGVHYTGPGTTDGNQTAFVNAGNISQGPLGTFLTVNTSYTLRVDVGDRLDAPFPGYRVQLLAGSTLLAEEFSLTPNDGFLTSTVSFSAFAGNPNLGQQVVIRLVSGGTQVNFDNVRLETDDATPAVPVPASLAIWGIGTFGLGFIYRRRKAAK